MGINEFMASILKEIGRGYTPMRTKAEKDKALEIINPRSARGGFLHVHTVICCDCGEPVNVVASPPTHTEKEIANAVAAMPEDQRPEIVVRQSRNYDPEKDKDVVPASATNMGMTTKKCGECGRQYVMCWEFGVCEVSRTLKFPWSDLESPDDSSSEPSMATASDTGTVH